MIRPKFLLLFPAAAVLLFLGAVPATLAGTLAAAVTATPSSAHLQILKPRDNAIVPVGDVLVEIAPLSGPEAAAGWQLYLDDKLVSSVPGSVVSYTVPVLESGPHNIQATFAGRPRSDPSGPVIAITAALSTPTTSPFNLSSIAPVMAIMTLGIIALIAVSLRIARRPVD